MLLFAVAGFADRSAELGTMLAAHGLPSDFKALKTHSRTNGLRQPGPLRQLPHTIATARHPAYIEPAQFVAAIMHLEDPLP